MTEDILNQAYAILEKNRNANEKILQSRRNAIISQFPEYKQLENVLSKTGYELAMTILNKKNNINSEIEEIKNRNLEIQRKMERILIQSGQSSDYLNEIYSCDKCHDTGIYKDKRCPCINEIAKSIAINKLNESSPLSLCSFESFHLDFYSYNKDAILGISPREMMEQNFKICNNFAQNFHIPMKSSGILMTGKTGLGKTHLSLAIAKAVIEKGYAAVYTSVPDILRKIEKEHFGSIEGDTLGVLESCDLLILDDLGAEFDSPFYISVIYNIINSRITKRKPLIVNTNMTASQIKNKYSDRVFSRLYSLETLSFFGEDIRLKMYK